MVGAADVDLFNGFFQRNALFRDGFFEWIKIYTNKINLTEAMIHHGFYMILVIAHVENTGMNLRRERFKRGRRAFQETR